MAKFNSSGLTVLGSGCFAKVYHHPSDNNKVIKVLEGNLRYVKYFDLYLHTLNARPNWAKIFQIDLYQNKASPYNIIVQEKIPIEFDSWKHSLVKIQNKKHKDPEVRDLIFVLKEIASRHSLGWDLHSGNLGERQDGSLAIYDPFTSGCFPEKE